jgi:hypothetical protein
MGLYQEDVLSLRGIGVLVRRLRSRVFCRKKGDFLLFSGMILKTAESAEGRREK